MKMHLTESSETLKMTISEGGGIITDLPPYEGSYDITPKVNPQTMQTKNKAMKDDVFIRQIPCEAVSNGSGTTITIGGY